MYSFTQRDRQRIMRNQGYRFWALNKPGIWLKGAALQTLGILSYNRRYTKNNVGLARFVIFASGRCGATLLMSLLDSHPNVKTRGELLARYRVFPYHWLRSNLWYFGEGGFGSRNNAFGFHLKVYQPAGMQHTGDIGERIVSWLDESGFQFIHLRRENWFLQVLSKVRMHCTGVWKISSDGPRLDNQKVYIDKDILLHVLEEQRANAEWEDRLLKYVTSPMLSLRYEPDLLNPEDQIRTAERCFSFLGVPRIEATTNVLKSASPNWWDDVANPDEVCRWLEEAGYERFLSLHTADHRQLAAAETEHRTRGL